jgi:hypothetical protein
LSSLILIPGLEIECGVSGIPVLGIEEEVVGEYNSGLKFCP